MVAWQRLFGAAVLVCALICALPARALASDTQESILQDDNELIYASPKHVAHALEQIAALGVDRVRVSMVWGLVAPDTNSSQRPSFDATNPDAYPRGAWNRYDTLVRLAQALGIKVYFQLTVPAPNWATTPPQLAQGYRWSHAPSAKEFGQFVQAVGRRYSGTYEVSAPATDTTPTLLGLPINIPGLSTPSTPPSPPNVIPRVDYWGIWNEPNIGGWMTPQWRKLRNGTKVEASPVIYRGLVDAAWSALYQTGHGTDTILLGETAAKGFPWKGYAAAMPPLVFLQALYCVSSAYRPLTGQRARELYCPASGSRTAFAAAHPGLFDATGWAHHPYSFDTPPNVHMADRSIVTLADLPRIEHALDRIFALYGNLPPGGVPLYLTEWGYKSNPPNPYVTFSQAQQAEYLNEGDYMAWLDPRVRAMGQFLLVDDRPKAGEAVGSRAYWSTFDTGLIQVNGFVKPAYRAFQIPIWLPVARHGSGVTVWGQLRPGNHSGLQFAVADYHPPRGAWTQLRVIQTDSPRGFLVAHVAIPGPGLLRLAWLQPGTDNVLYSRTVSVS